MLNLNFWIYILQIRCMVKLRVDKNFIFRHIYEIEDQFMKAHNVFFPRQGNHQENHYM